jgi:OmpA-OmpF porin, OOP family
MKRTLSSVILVILLVAAGFSLAVGADYEYGITPYLGYHFFNDRFDNDNYKDAFEAGIRLEKNFTSRWGAELGAGYVATERQSTGADHGSITYMLNGVYNLVETGKFIPYVTAGIGGDYTDGKALAGLDAGIGAKVYLTESMILRPEVRYINLFDGREDLVVALGLTFPFGKTAKAAPASQQAPAQKPAPVPAVVPDSDRDGVPDNLDKCPDTPSGVKVDGNGCPLDSDHDGVPDNLDKCPDTPSGVKVDGNGCPLDSDHDGVPDYLDKCPDTPGGSKVDVQGCVVSIRLKVNFDTGQAVVKEQYLTEIEKFAQYMKQYPDQKAEIQGHTDNMGNPKSNQKLSEARAGAVREVLVKKFSIAPDRLTFKGYGQEKPIAGNDTPEGREQNRRVEAVIVK